MYVLHVDGLTHRNGARVHLVRKLCVMLAVSVGQSKHAVGNLTILRLARVVIAREGVDVWVIHVTIQDILLSCNVDAWVVYDTLICIP